MLFAIYNNCAPTRYRSVDYSVLGDKSCNRDKFPRQPHLKARARIKNWPRATTVI
jgi:hypothetical protein